MYLIATISANPHPAGGSGSVSKSKEPVKSAFKWFRGFDINKPKGPHDFQTQEHDNEDTTTSNVGPEHGPSGFTDIFLGPDEDINTEVGLAKKSGDSTSGHTQNEDHKGAIQRSSKLAGIKKKLKIPKGYLFRPKRTPQSLSTWYLDSDTNNPKEPQDTQTQEQSDEDIATPNAGPEHDSSGFREVFVSSALARKADIYWKKRNKEFRLRHAKVGDPERVDKSPKASETDKQKGPQDPQTQEQGDEDITTSNTRPEHDSSDSTGAAAGSDEATNTNVYREEENGGSTSGHTQAKDHKGSSQRSSKLAGIKKKLKIPKGYLHKPKETTQRSSKLVESGQEVMRLLKRPKLPILNTNLQNPIQFLMPKKKKPITFKDPEEDDKVNVWDILSLQ
ncbi:hypothetical protein BASA81_011883 [Batrachochytrium salamandrivorans]|nr:hypothetical protein BASA81_011883 [Batrachochytrium salamandrivorans]